MALKIKHYLKYTPYSCDESPGNCLAQIPQITAYFQISFTYSHCIKALFLKMTDFHSKLS